MFELTDTPQRDLEAVTQKSECEIAVLTERKAALEVIINDLEDAARLQDQATAVMKAEYDAKLQEQQTAFHGQLAQEASRVDDIGKALGEAHATREGLEAQVVTEKNLVALLQEELREAKLPSSAHQEVVDVLNAQILALRSENTNLMLRARNIDARCKAGDLVTLHILCRTRLTDDVSLVLERGREGIHPYYDPNFPKHSRTRTYCQRQRSSSCM